LQKCSKNGLKTAEKTAAEKRFADFCDKITLFFDFSRFFNYFRKVFLLVVQF